MWFLNLETTHTNRTSTHWPRLISVSYAITNNCTYLLESLKTSAGIAQSLLSLTRIPLCNISPLFLATYYNIPSKKSFLEDFVRPSADKPNSSLLKVPCNTLRLGSLIPDHLTYQIIFFFPKKIFFAYHTRLNNTWPTQTVLHWTVTRIFTEEWLASSANCNSVCTLHTKYAELKSLTIMTFSYFTKKTSQEKLAGLLEVQEEIKRMKQQHLAPRPSKTEQTHFSNSDLDQGWRQAGKPQFKQPVSLCTFSFARLSSVKIC